MSLDPVTTTPIILSNLSQFSGVSLLQLSTGIALGLSLYANSGIIVNSIDVGTLGSGVGTGVGVFFATPFAVQSMISSFQSNSISGTASVPIATSIAIGLVQCLGQSIIQTVNPTVGVGTGVVQLVGNPSISTQIFFSAMGSSGFSGTSLLKLAKSVADGLDGFLASGTGNIVISGPSSTNPSSGAGTGKLL